jgi:hypothetical protein
MLELSGDPDARKIAYAYKSSPLNPMPTAIRVSGFRIADSYTYQNATQADADEAEEHVAQVQAKRESARRKREEQLHDFARAADRRETWMLRLTATTTGVSLLSLAAAVAAVVIAVAGS